MKAAQTVTGRAANKWRHRHWRSNMDMLTKNGRLLDEIAKVFRVR